MKRKSKKHISNNLIALLIVIFGIIMTYNNWLIYKNAEKLSVTGLATVSTATIDLCLNNKPSLSNCQSTATVGTLYTCDIDIDTNQTLTVSDNTSLFNVTNDGNINFTPSSANVGFHAIEINASDNSGCTNSDNTLLLNVTISEEPVPSAPSAGAPSAGAGGGGGGGAAVQLPTNEVSSEQRRWATISAGEVISLVIDNINIAITNIVIDIINTLSNIDLKVASLKQNPTEVVPSAKVYQYLEITRNNLENSDALKITISFRIPKNWLSENKVAEKDMVLYRFQNTRWNELNTILINSDSNYAYYEAITPGFSTFAAVASNEPPLADFAVDRDLMKITLKQFETKTASFKIKNTANIKVNINIDADLGNYVTIKEKKIILEPGEEKVISFDVKVEDEPNLYTGKIFLISAYLRKEIKLILEVQPVVSLFDVKVLVPKQFKQVQKGSIVAADIALINIGEPTTAILHYSIRDLNNEEIVANEEKLYVKEPFLINRELKLPDDISVGKYIFYVSLIAGPNRAFATDVFEVVKVPFIEVPLQFQFRFIGFLAVMFAVLLIITYYNITRKKKIEKPRYEKISRLDVELLLKKIKPEEAVKWKNKIEKELEVLKADYQSDYISLEEYRKRRKKLEKQLKKLEKYNNMLKNKIKND